ncbi:MAG: hypothetical protein HYW77_02795 [Parcubacteria group bacterium]|nr:hypothetical protein [Parcubacteria group bacterium]
MKKYSQKILAVIIILTFFLPSVVNGGAIMAFLNPLILKELVLDQIVKTLGTTFLNKTVSKMIDSVKTGGIGGKEAAIVFDWRKFLLNSELRGENIFAIELKRALEGGGNFRGGGAVICDKYREIVGHIFTNLNLNLVNTSQFGRINQDKTDISSFLTQVRCSDFANKSADEIEKDLFSGKNWNRLTELFAPGNTLGGIVFLSANELEKQKQVNKEANKSEAEAGGGFLSKRPGSGCIYNIQGGEQNFSYASCIIKNTIGIPGSVLSDSTSEAIRANLENLISADEIGELGGLIVSLVVDKLLGPNASLGNPAPLPTTPLPECSEAQIKSGNIENCNINLNIPTPVPTALPNPTCTIDQSSSTSSKITCN